MKQDKRKTKAVKETPFKLEDDPIKFEKKSKDESKGQFKLEDDQNPIIDDDY